MTKEAKAKAMDGDSYTLEWYRRRSRSKKGPHQSGRHLADVVYEMFHPRNCIDLGGGTFSFANRLAERGVLVTATGYPACCSEFAGPDIRFLAADLSKPIALRRRFEMVTSWEVFEHIPEKFERVLVRTVTQLAQRWALLSIDPSTWGHGHVNCKSKGYWRKLFGEAGLIFEPQITKELSIKVFLQNQITSKAYARNLSVYSVLPRGSH